MVDRRKFFCEIAVEGTFKKVSGINWAKLDFEKKNIAVTFVSDRASPATLTKATSDAGYPSTVHH